MQPKRRRACGCRTCRKSAWRASWRRAARVRLQQGCSEKTAMSESSLVPGQPRTSAGLKHPEMAWQPSSTRSGRHRPPHQVAMQWGRRGPLRRGPLWLSCQQGRPCRGGCRRCQTVGAAVEMAPSRRKPAPPWGKAPPRVAGVSHRGGLSAATQAAAHQGKTARQEPTRPHGAAVGQGPRQGWPEVGLKPRAHEPV